MRREMARACTRAEGTGKGKGKTGCVWGRTRRARERSMMDMAKRNHIQASRSGPLIGSCVICGARKSHACLSLDGAGNDDHVGPFYMYLLQIGGDLGLPGAVFPWLPWAKIGSQNPNTTAPASDTTHSHYRCP